MSLMNMPHLKYFELDSHLSSRKHEFDEHARSKVLGLGSQPSSR